MIALLLALALAGPPKAYLATPTAHVPLAVSSWCWGSHCGAPIAASAKTAVVARGSLVRVELAFEPTQVRVEIGGAPALVVYGSHEISWRARKGGGMTITVNGGRGWVTYVGRLNVR